MFAPEFTESATAPLHDLAPKKNPTLGKRGYVLGERIESGSTAFSRGRGRYRYRTTRGKARLLSVCSDPMVPGSGLLLWFGCSSYHCLLTEPHIRGAVRSSPASSPPRPPPVPGDWTAISGSRVCLEADQVTAPQSPPMVAGSRRRIGFGAASGFGWRHIPRGHVGSPSVLPTRSSGLRPHSSRTSQRSRY